MKNYIPIFKASVFPQHKILWQYVKTMNDYCLYLHTNDILLYAKKTVF